MLIVICILYRRCKKPRSKNAARLEFNDDHKSIEMSDNPMHPSFDNRRRSFINDDAADELPAGPNYEYPDDYAETSFRHPNRSGTYQTAAAHTDSYAEIDTSFYSFSNAAYKGMFLFVCRCIHTTLLRLQASRADFAHLSGILTVPQVILNLQCPV